jgi:hypothetical protein
MPIVTDPKTGKRVMIRTPGSLSAALAHRFLPEGFDFTRSPQQHDEPSAAYGARMLFSAPIRGTVNVGNRLFDDLAQGVQYGLSTPDSIAAQQRTAAPAPQQVFSPAAAAGNSFPNSYKDPVYDQAEQIASRQFGVPVEVLRGIRLRGERSNNNQVSSAGAKTPYQFIPSTASGVQRNYGINVFNSPVDAAKGAAAVLSEGFKRTGSWDGAVTQYIGGTDPSHYGPQTAAYRQRVLGPNTDLMAPLVNPFSAEYGNKAIGEINSAQASALQPETFSIDRPAPPAMPAPIQAAPTDFTEADSALQAMQPVAMDEKQKLHIQRTSLFQGLGTALMNLPDGAGLGKVLAAAGGGALAGRMAGDKEVLRRQDKFDEEMAQFRAAVYTNKMQEAEIHGREAAQNVNQLNQYALTNWQTQYQQWSKDNHVDVTGDAVVSTRQGGDGKIEVTRTPIRAAVMAGFALQRAHVYQALGGEQNAGNSLVASANNTLAGIAATQSAAAATAGSPDQVQGLVGGLALPATTVVQNGRAFDVFGNDADYNAARSEIDGRMNKDGWQHPLPGDAQGEVKYRTEFNNRLAELLVRMGLRDPTGQFRARIFGAAMPGLLMDRAEQQQRRSQRTSTDYRGRTTTSTTISGDASE